MVTMPRHGPAVILKARKTEVTLLKRKRARNAQRALFGHDAQRHTIFTKTITVTNRK